MGILDSIKSIFSGGGGSSGDRGTYFYIKCKNCGEKIRVRVDTFNEPAQDIDDNEKVTGFTLDKDVMGNNCFKMMRLHVAFDTGRRITEQSVENGTLISRQEYEAQ